MRKLNLAVLIGLALVSLAAPVTASATPAPDVFAWGDNPQGQLGDGTTGNSLVPVGVVNTGALAGKTITATGAGGSFACALTGDGLAACWGIGSAGQLGNHGTSNSSVPVAVDTNGVLLGKTLAAISVSYSHACALDTDGRAYCWGAGGGGRLGNGLANDSDIPVAVDMNGVLAGKTLTSIGAGYGHTCALDTDGKAYCWGEGARGQLGDNASSNSSVPVVVSAGEVPAGRTLTAISSGWSYSCALDNAGKAYCWGAGSTGQLGDNTTSDSPVPVAVNTSGELRGRTLTMISASGHTCALDSDGRAYCWGQGGSGELGNNATSNSSIPVAVYTDGDLAGQPVAQVSAGMYHSCAVADDGSAYCWGANWNGQLGDNSATSARVPVAVDTGGVLSGRTLAFVSAGNFFTTAMFGLPPHRNSSSAAGSPGAPDFTFVFQLPDGRACGTISPAVVKGGSSFALPGAEAECRTPGSSIAGWRIPGQSWPLRAGRTVVVVDSQVFTAVLDEPSVTVRYDANVGRADACLAQGVDVAVGERVATSLVERSAFEAVGTAVEVPCAPAAHTLAGWLHRPSGTQVKPGEVLPSSLLRDDDGYPVNSIDVYAVWAPRSAF